MNLESYRKYLKFIVVVIIFAVLPLIITSSTVLDIIVYMFFFAYFALAWSILGRFLGQLSLGHAIFFGIGSYATLILFLDYGYSPWIGMFVGAIIAGIIGILLGVLTFRFRGPYYALSTLAFAEILYVIALIPRLEWLTGGALGRLVEWKGVSFKTISFLSKVPYYYIMGIMLLVLVIVAYKIKKSKMGFYFRAIREDEDAASSIGINVYKYKLIGAGISAFFTGILGAFYISYVRYIDPLHAFGLWRSVDPIIYSIFGGAGIIGPILGSFILTPFTQGLRIFYGAQYGSYVRLIYGLVLVCILLFRPDGVSGLFKKAWNRLNKLLEDIYENI